MQILRRGATAFARSRYREEGRRSSSSAASPRDKQRGSAITGHGCAMFSSSLRRRRRWRWRRLLNGGVCRCCVGEVLLAEGVYCGLIESLMGGLGED